ncbi:nucleosome assembly protein [Capsaspora owczarzaki ATCC 30864]|uniref:Nucleosome assembly protein n=1 Tax=Capsaspora owczarzaki (strain ATCC 30864) TaxID=595528 RepID=A0A0D2WXN2_CAPO3|nr:nucleosome assembly protein [Capsaspora owczarzaki ATCC 30864]KJE97538.1 nucleosome assembly protein [Capsaspora owczarzaki ATCC 30864]|eukprot:XP_004343237.1 nucleosome assembly protein [Capsaspora owczarzaki ATCC 30864]
MSKRAGRSPAKHAHSHDHEDHDHDHDDHEEGTEAEQQAAIQALLAQNPQLAAMINSRLGSIAGQSSGLLESFPEDVQRRIKALKNLHVKHLELETEYQKEVNALERKYLKLYTPLYEKRATIAAGAYEPTDEEANYVSDNEEDEEDDDEEEESKKDEKPVKKEKEDEDKPAEPVKGIPAFWLTTLKNLDMLTELIREEDEPALLALKDIVIAPLTDNDGFQLVFHFDDNEFFTNKTLTKTYTVSMEKGGELVYSGTTGCDIAWKEGKNLSVKTITKTQRHKGKGTKRTVTQTVPNETFFQFFSPPKTPEGEDEELDEEQEGLLAQDFEIGETLKTRVIPHAVLWFTGEALDYEDYEDEEGDDDEEDYDDEEGDDDGEDEEQDEDFDPKKAQPNKPAECKQQ